jgi:biopolymer transport protein TolR
VARRTSIKPLREINEINMTPLIDLTFLLLITFIITMPLLEQGIPVNLPRGKARELDQTRSHSITLNIKGQVYLDQQEITREELATQMVSFAKADPEVIVMVRADEGIQYGRIIEIMRILQDAQITRMALVTSPENKPGP